ncbi:MAG: M56 family metallopeptidase, partial [Verrucomicrobiales bacterium]
MKRLIELMILAPVATLAVPVLVDSAFKGALLLAVILIAMLLLRRSPSALRHAVLVSAMALLLVLPILSLTLPGWRVLPSWAKLAPSDYVATPVETGHAPAVEFASDFPAAGPQPDTLPSQEVIATPTAERGAASWIPLVVWLWSIGATLLGFRLTLSQLALWHLGHKARPAEDPRLIAMALRHKQELGIRRQVDVLLHPGRPIPMTWGIFKTRLLLPAAAEGWDEIRLRAVLLHELAHIRRGDSQTQLLTHLTCAVHWFNPLAWIAARQIATERERACDDLVLNSGIRASDYAEQLLRIATGYETGPVASLSAVAMAKRSRLEGRVTNILNKRVDRRSVTRRVAASVACGLALLALPVAMMQAAGQDDGEKRASEDRPKAPAENLEALVLDTRSGWGLVVISVGSDDGVREGMVFSWERAGTHMGELEVISTRDGVSICDTQGDLHEDSPLPGDRAIIKNPDDPDRKREPGLAGTQAANTSIDDLIEADANLSFKPHQVTIGDRSEPMGFAWFEEPTDLATDERNSRGAFTTRYEHNDALLVTQGYQYHPTPKVKTPIFQREFLGGARNLRGYDFRQAADREPLELNTSDDPGTEGGTQAKTTRKYFKGPGGRTFFVDLDPDKVSNSFFPEDFSTEEYRVEPQPDNQINLTEKASDGTFRVRDRIHVTRFYDSKLPVDHQHSFVRVDLFEWLDEPVDLLSNPVRPFTYVRYRLDRATIAPIETPDGKEIDTSEGERQDLQFAGIGMVLRRAEGVPGTIVHKLLKGAPAEKAGTVQLGDRIVGFSNGKDGEWVETAELDLVEIVDLIRGKAGTTVRLKLHREEPDREIISEVAVERELLKLEPANPNPVKAEPG